jgi:hypothetical protein
MQRPLDTQAPVLPLRGSNSSGGSSGLAGRKEIWVAVTDPSSGGQYFYNAVTRETRWDRPTAATEPGAVLEIMQQDAAEKLAALTGPRAGRLA